MKHDIMITTPLPLSTGGHFQMTRCMLTCILCCVCEISYQKLKLVACDRFYGVGSSLKILSNEAIISFRSGLSSLINEIGGKSK